MHAFFDTRKHPELVWVGIVVVAMTLTALPFALAGVGTALTSLNSRTNFAKSANTCGYIKWL